MEFSAQLKKIREQMGFSQEKMAQELSVSFATINRIETGKSKPCYDTLKKFEYFCNQKKISIGEKHD